MVLLPLLRVSPRARPLALRSFSRMPLPPSIPASALRPLVAFSPLSPPRPTTLRLPAADTRSVPLAGTGHTARVVQEGGPLAQGGRECWILANGSVVGWGVEGAELRAWAGRLWQHPSGTAAVAGDEEQLDFLVDGSSPAPRLQGDIVVLPSTPSPSAPSVEASASDPALADAAEPDLTQLLIRYAISEALSHSSQLNIVEAQLDSLVSKDVDVPSYLAKHGRGPYSRKQVIQRLGEFLEVRQKVSLKGLGDVPDLYWEEPLLEKYFQQTRKLLEIEKRVGTVNERIAHSQEVHGILKDLLTEKSTHNMEIIIILLIAVEVSLAFWTHWEELRAAFGNPTAPPPAASAERAAV